jgi:hypothetical protein
MKWVLALAKSSATPEVEKLCHAHGITLVSDPYRVKGAFLLFQVPKK